MSQSPLDAPTDGADEPAGYRAALDDWSRLVRAGLSHSGRERNRVFFNTGGGRFADISSIAGFDYLDDGRSLVWTDWDLDGDLDLWAANRTGPQLRLLINRRGQESPSLQFRLRGTESNRDAIGARVELRLVGDRAPRVAVVRAGTGFLGQSTREIHFGLGEAPVDVESLSVRWPSGSVETIAGVTGAGRYSVVEGEGRARPIARAGGELALAASPLVPPAPTLAGRVWLSARPPVPAVRFDRDGREVRLESYAGKPTLLNLWATWCVPCRDELAELQARRGELAERGLQVVALNVDGLGDDRAASPEAIAAYVDALGLQFEVASARAEMIDKFELLYSQLFGRRISLPVPVSILVDAHGLVAGFYFGRIDLDRLLDDVAHLDDPPEAIAERALRFPGRRWSPQAPLDYEQLADEYFRAGHVEDAAALYEWNLRHDPDNARVRANAGSAQLMLGRLDAAEAHLARALELDPAAPKTLYSLGLLRQRRGRFAESIEFLQRSLQAAPDQPGARFALAGALARERRIDEAIAEGREALRLRPDWSAAEQFTLWMIATYPGVSAEAIEDGLRLARRRVDRLPEDAESLAMLGAIHARAGRWAEALSTARSALAVAERSGQPARVRRLQQHIDAYRSQRALVRP